MRLTPGTKLDSYEILALLGAGGMGEVYRARDPALKREVAIEVLPSFVSRDPDRLQRFEQEAQAAAALDHPNILAVHRFGAFDGTSYLVSELLTGESLRHALSAARSRFARPSTTASRSPTDWPQHMNTASFIAISSPKTCSSQETAASRSSTSVLQS